MKRVSFLVVAILCFVTTAYADDRADSTALKKLGDGAMDSLRYDEALRYYTDAYSKYPDPAILYNRGRVYGARGEYPRALAEFEKFDRDASPELHAKVPLLQQLMAEMASHVATVKITCDQPGARILVRDQVAGTTPLDPLRLTAGKADFEVTKDGFTPVHQTRDLVGGKSVDIAFTLVPVNLRGVLVLSAKGVNARAAIDGKPAGMTPLEASVDPGQHKVYLRADGYQDIESSAVVATGERKELAVEMKKNPTILTKWWFWTGVAVVVAAAVVVTVAATTEKSPSTGDHFTPSQVRGPLTIAW